MNQPQTNKDQMVLYAYNFPSRAERVLWALEELKLPYELIRLNGQKGEQKTPSFLSLNPEGKIPVLRHGSRVLTESLAIIEYLDDLSDEVSLVPENTWPNYLMRRAIQYGMTEIEPYLWIADQSTRLKRLYHWPETTFEEAVSRIEKALPAVERWLATDTYFASDQFSMADIYLYHLLRWSKKYNISITENTNNYLERLEQRPNFYRFHNN